MSDVFVRNYKPLNDMQKRHVDWIKHKAEDVLNAFYEATYADPRCMAIAVTNLEQAIMWAVKGVTNPPPPPFQTELPKSPVEDTLDSKSITKNKIITYGNM